MPFPQETKEDLVREYCEVVKNRGWDGKLRGSTHLRFAYLKARIPQLLVSVDDLIWAAEQYAEVHRHRRPYLPFIRLAAEHCETLDQVNRLFPVVPPTGPVRDELLEKAIAFANTKEELALFVREHLK